MGLILFLLKLLKEKQLSVLYELFNILVLGFALTLFAVAILGPPYAIGWSY